jgi:hypothetical protein
MALFIMNENYEYDEVTAFLESLEQDVECVLTEAALKQSSKAVRDAKRAARFKVNDLKQEPAKAEADYEQGFKSIDSKRRRGLIQDLSDRNNSINKADEDYNAKLQQNEAQLKKVIESKPRSWVERKLVQFKAALRRFRNKYGTAKDGKSKTILQKIISTLTRIISWITDKVLKGARFIQNKFGGAKKAEDYREKFRNAKMLKDSKDQEAADGKESAIDRANKKLLARRKGRENIANRDLDRLTYDHDQRMRTNEIGMKKYEASKNRRK